MRGCGILSKKIASIGVWGNGRFPQLNFPSAGAEAKQGYRFLFAYWDFLIAFIVGLMPRQLSHFSFIGFASRQLKSNLLLMLWQIKNDTLAGQFDFWGCLPQKLLRNGLLLFSRNGVRNCYGIFKKQCKYESDFGWARWLRGYFT